MAIFAVVSSINGGYTMDKARIDEAGFQIGDRIEVEHISMGQSSTSIRLKDHKGMFNSVFFSFEEDDQPLNIYGDERFNPYL